MRNSLWIILTVLLVVIGAPNAHADGGIYTISFTGSDAPTVVGSDLLFFNSTLNEFTTPSSEIDFFGNDITLDATLLAPTDPLTNRYVWGADQFAFEVSDFTSGLNLYQGSAANTGCEFADEFECEGGVVLTAQTPEPAAGVLMLLGVGMAFLLRKRMAQGLPQAT
jgi:hypothetical protein